MDVSIPEESDFLDLVTGHPFFVGLDAFASPTDLLSINPRTSNLIDGIF